MSEPTAVTWNSRPLFVSSTFADMHDERNFLRVHAFDWLEKEKLKERRHYLEVIDLRQGLETSDEGDDTGRELKVIRVCLDEIKRSRPFFIGILGDRYGWDPPEERMEAAAKAAGFSCDVTGKKSVTELEILYGVLENPDQCERSWFYLREMDYTGMPDEVRKRFDERFAGDTEKADKLDALKERIKKELPDHIRTYQAKWDPKMGKVVGLEDLREKVREDLWTALDPETQKWLRDAPKTWQEADARQIDDFVVDRLRIVDGEIKGFVERGDVTDPLIKHAFSPATEGANWGICLTGEAGSGKSSLFARVYYELRQRQQNDREEGLWILAHAAGIYPSSGSVDTTLRRWIHELAGLLEIDDPLAAEEEQHGSASSDQLSPDNPLNRSTNPSSAEEIEETFASLIGRASQIARVVVLIDALNQFAGSTRARYLTWLPKLWPENARVIATAIPGNESEAFAGKPGFGVKALQKMSQEEARQVAHQFYKERFHRKPNDRALDILLAKPLPDGKTFAYSNPLWLELALQEMNLLEADDYKQAEKNFPKLDGDKRIEALQVREADNLPPDPAGMYGELLARAGRDFGGAFTGAVMRLIAVSRAGWRESDLLALVPVASGGPWDELAFAGLRRTLGSHLVQRGAHRQWDAFHAQLRERILAQDLGDHDLCRHLHSVIADHLEGLPEDDPLRISETMVHLIGFGDRTRAARYLAQQDWKGESERTAAKVLAQHAAAEKGGIGFMVGLLKAIELNDDEIWRVVSSLSDEGLNYLARETDLAAQLTLLGACQSALELLIRNDPLNAFWQDQLVVIHGRIGYVKFAQGRLDEALKRFRQSLTIAERLVGNTPNPFLEQRLSNSCLKIGDVYFEQGSFKEALKSYQQSLVIAERLIKRQSPIYHRPLSLSHRGIGDAQLSQKNPKDALESYRRSLEVTKHILEQIVHEDLKVTYLRDLGGTYARIGDAQIEISDYQGALKAYQHATEVAEGLIRKDPSHVGFQRDLSISHLKLGDVQFAQCNFVEALDAYRAFQATMESLSKSDPSNANWLGDLCVSHQKVGDVLLKLGNVSETLDAYRQVVRIHEDLLDRNPLSANWLRDLCASHQKVGDLLRGLGKFDEALDAYRKSAVIWEDLVRKDPSKTTWQSALASIKEKIGAAQQHQGHFEDALKSLEQSKKIRKGLVHSNPSHPRLQHDLARSIERIGDVLFLKGDLEGALSSFQRKLEIVEWLVRNDPVMGKIFERDLCLLQKKIGDVLRGQKNLGEALSAYRESMEVAERLAQSDPSSAVWQHDLSVSCDLIGDAMLEQRKVEEALSAYRESMKVRERLARNDPSKEVWQRLLVVSHYQLSGAARLNGQNEECNQHLLACKQVMIGMQDAGMPLDPQLEQLLAQLKGLDSG